MANLFWYRNVGDSGPPLVSILKEDGNPVDLSTASDVKVRVVRRRADRERQGTPALVAASFGVAVNGEVKFAAISSYTSDKSTWLIQWVVTDAGGNVATYPSDGTTMVLEVSNPV